MTTVDQRALAALGAALLAGCATPGGEPGPQQPTIGARSKPVLEIDGARARGRLPFELPRSMAAVAAQDPAAPDDSEDPLYQRGAGIVTP